MSASSALDLSFERGATLRLIHEVPGISDDSTALDKPNLMPNCECVKRLLIVCAGFCLCLSRSFNPFGLGVPDLEVDHVLSPALKEGEGGLIRCTGGFHDLLFVGFA